MKTEKQKIELLDKIVAAAVAHVDRAQAAMVEGFVSHFYANVPGDDIHGEAPGALAAAALSVWQFALERKPGEAKVRIFSPRMEEHGWATGHTLVEIVNDDMPFLVDSVTAEINRQELNVHLLIHPIYRIERGVDGKIAALDAPKARAESVMQLRITQIIAPERMAALRERIEVVLRDVRAAVEDWPAMRARLRAVLAEIGQDRLPLPEGEVREGIDFLEWIDADHFTYLGYREYTFSGEGEAVSYRIVEDKALGVLRDWHVRVFDGIRNRDNMPPDVRNFLRQPQLIMVTKANLRSSVHRDAYLDTIGVKIFDAQGRVTGERLFAGLFTSTAYNRSPWDIPLLRRKVAWVAARAGFAPNSHDAKALEHILETFPREELFQISDDDLYEMALGILHLQERQRVALFTRRDPYERFVSCFVYVPRDRISSNLRRRIAGILERAFAGKLNDSFVQMVDQPLARLHFLIATTPGEIPAADLKLVESQIAQTSRSWTDAFQEALIAAKGEAAGVGLMRDFRDAFQAGYQVAFDAASAVEDADFVRVALRSSRPAINLYRPAGAGANVLHLKLYQAGEKIALSTVLPSLENFGLKVISENPFEIKPAGQKKSVWLHDFAMVSADDAPLDLEKVRANFHEAYGRIWSGEMEDDGFNRLVLVAGLSWRDVTILRAYCKYLRQAAIAFSQTYMEQTLNANPAIAQAVVALFYARFDPAFAGDRAAAEKKIAASILTMLDKVANLDDDRILRRFWNAAANTLRTNAFQTAADGAVKPYLSFKLNSQKIEDLPLPRPMVEVFVYSPRVEAIHLRGGKVARGGIRWSDRREDFRTEILGLMKAQMVKNAVIVPVGSKGGFVVKQPPANGSREALMAEVVDCYKTLIRGLLDITDNLVAGKIVPPPSVVRHDDDDPYLVVAADKGTATFSDIANGVSRDYGFWLDDAFASGGSAGYDHKKMGITARGAWECVKRHFREIGHDIQSADFTCVGVGDMSGDVFGNGMLLSAHTRLVAAFNHLHIFIDPDPDPKASFAERKRLFDLPRSAWSDYDPKVLSKGGGVYERKAKSISLSPEARARFGIDKEQLTPNELIQVLLKAEVDLLFLGGIGTYVKASGESHAEVGDRANDAVRINGATLRCKVVGEGANLGLTQRGRIEAALNGRRLNTDALDNSAGVDTSDHEVNIKIALNEAVTSGALTMARRDDLLAAMTEDVGLLVLRDNYLQSQAVSLAATQSYMLLDQQGRFMRALERQGKLDRAIEYLPDDETLRQRLQLRVGLTRSELSVLLAYAKTSLYEDLLPSDLPDDPQLAEDLVNYFPVAMHAPYRALIQKHRLRREIIATVVTNSLINRMGMTFVHVMKEKTGQPVPAIARAYTLTRAVFRLREAWDSIEALDNVVDAAVQAEALLEINRLAEQATLWFLRNNPGPLDIAAMTAAMAPGIAALEAALPTIVAPAEAASIAAHEKTLTARGLPQALAARTARFASLVPALDIVRIAHDRKIGVEDVGATYFAVGERFGLDWLRTGARALIGDSHWQRLAVFAIIDDLYGHQRDLTLSVLQGGAATGAAAIEAWGAARAAPRGRVDGLLAELRQAGKLELAMLAVANRTVRSLLD